MRFVTHPANDPFLGTASAVKGGQRGAWDRDNLMCGGAGERPIKLHPWPHLGQDTIMPIKIYDLARAIVHWVGFESACGRENLLSEASMIVPLGQYLKSHTMDHIELECPYPAMPRRRIDIALLNDAMQRDILQAFEMKFIRQSGRDYAQELFDDIIRLGTIRTNLDNEEVVGRFLVVAGVWNDIKTKVLDHSKLDAAAGFPIKVFQSILPQNVLGPDNANRIELNIAASGGVIQSYWKESQVEHKLQSIPKKLLIDLRAMYPKMESVTPRSYTCLIWRILRVADRQVFSLID